MKTYYLGLDIGTDSVGYAATNETYDLMKWKGDPVWGVTTFEAASTAAERRAVRTSRRRYDRRQQRVQLVSELFAEEICKIDPNFFIRRKESALFADDSSSGVQIFDGGISDKEYHDRYPTIHHLIDDLMTSSEPHDVRLVYLAAAWLVANRGHFLLDVPVNNIAALMDFSVPYEKFRIWLADLGRGLPWDESVQPETILGIMQLKAGSTKKQEAFKAQVYGGKAPSKKNEGDFPFNRNEVIKLLCGAVSKPKDLYFREDYSDMASVSLSMPDEAFSAAAAELGEDGELLTMLRGMYDCSLLISGIGAGRTVSRAKIEIYEQHKADLKYLKAFLRKYRPKEFGPMFRAPGAENYVAYSYHVKSCKEPQKVGRKANKQVFTDYLKKAVKGITVEEADRAQYEDMMNRLELQSFLPKQKDTDNRVIPMQLYHHELAEVLRQAAAYLPMLNRKDETGLTTAEKVLSIFDFRIPYFVGPLNPASSHAWLERKAGKIYPWNFEQMVDLDTSEQNFIARMTNKCTYYPGKDVLPVSSLLYERFTVLNAINNLKINGNPIPVQTKQAVFLDLFADGKAKKSVTFKAIRDYLISRCGMRKEDTLSGLDETYKGSLKTRQSFRRMLASGVLTEEQAESIIRHAAYSEDKQRFSRWLQREFPAVSPEDRKYILGLNLKGFGRLSREFLTELVGADKETDEAKTILEALWDTNENLMQLLSERYTYREQLDALAEEYYSEKKLTLSQRLDEMYISNAVKRPIIRALDITSDVVKAMGGAPKKIFIEMARGSTEAQRGKRTQTRKQQLMALYKSVRNEDARRLMKELEDMGEMADNRLQSDKLFLYYLQLGRCMYTGEAIELTGLFTDRYDIDHIYPRRFVKDDSVLNNKVLVTSKINGVKGERYPVDESIRNSQRPRWEALRSAQLITEEKFLRLTRSTGFTDEEKYQFINRQLVETRQSTKAVAQLLKERYPDAEIVYVKAGLVSEFRQKFDMLKCRSVNDLHHAKDAYLNIVAGNVYSEKFTKKWFRIQDNYSLNTKALYTHPVICGGQTVWRGDEDIAKVSRYMAKNAIHLTRYAFCRKGSLFDLMPLKAQEGLIPRKVGLPAEKYGGYRKPTATFFALAKGKIGKKAEVMLIPVSLMDAAQFLADSGFAVSFAQRMMQELNSKPVTEVTLPFGNTPIKVNTVFSFDGLRMTLSGKSGGGRQLLMAPISPLILSRQQEHYIKALEAFSAKKSKNAAICLDSVHDHITPEENLVLYQELTTKLSKPPFSHLPGNQHETLKKGQDAFVGLSPTEQVSCLMNILVLFRAVSSGTDLTSIGGSKSAGVKVVSSGVSNWQKAYHDVHIIDLSASGLYESQNTGRNVNLLDLL